MTTERTEPPASSWRRLLLLPSAARFGAQAPRDARDGWGRFWRAVGSTGDGGDVLWDSSNPGESEQHLPIVLQHLDRSMPVIDIGCGNGRQSRLLAEHFPAVVGVDLSAEAIALAEKESAGIGNLRFEVLDLLADNAGARLAGLFTEANIFVRGVFHVMPPHGQQQVARALRAVLGARGRVFLAETNYVGGSLGYLQHLGARPGRIPGPLLRAIQTIPKPRPFGPVELRKCFPAAQWTVELDGTTQIYAIPMQRRDAPEYIPGYYAVLVPVTSAA